MHTWRTTLLVLYMLYACSSTNRHYQSIAVTTHSNYRIVLIDNTFLASIWNFPFIAFPLTFSVVACYFFPIFCFAAVFSCDVILVSMSKSLFFSLLLPFIWIFRKFNFERFAIWCADTIFFT